MEKVWIQPLDDRYFCQIAGVRACLLQSVKQEITPRHKQANVGVQLPGMNWDSFTCDEWSWQYLVWEDLGRWSLYSDLGIYGCPRIVCFGARAWGRSPLDVYTYLHSTDCVAGEINN